MNVMWLMIPATLLLTLGFVYAFFRAVNSGQFDDVDSPAYRILENEPQERTNHERQHKI